jgi:hypothetical protein
MDTDAQGGFHARSPFVCNLTRLVGLTLASAEQSQDFGPYAVYYSAITTDTPLPVARQYGITRSKNRAVLTMTVLKKVMNTTGTPVSATSGNATNLSAQMRGLTAYQGRETIYYISGSVADCETLDFNLQVVPAGGQPLAVRFGSSSLPKEGVFHSRDSAQ